MTKGAKPEISIIIPCFDAEKTIINTLDSINAQTYRNFEVIIVNDGSKDESEWKIKRYICENPSIKIDYFFQNNQGVSVARNEGIKRACGKYIAFIDADDLYHPQFLEILYSALVRKNIDIACCRYRIVGLDDCFGKETQKTGVDAVKSKEDILDKYIHKRKNRFSFLGAIYKKKIIEDNKLLFPTDIRFGEDTEFVCKYLVHCRNGGVFLEKELYGYLRHGQSVMHGMCDWTRTDNLKAVKNVIDYWTKNSACTDFAEYMFSRALWACAKDFSIEDRRLFRELQNKYNLEHAMKVMARCGDEVSIRVSALAFLIDKRLFRILITGYVKKGGLIT